ncbi:hypothetical protein [Nodularia chucula]|uniref:hypothetical protein n=1 Tax=Nodularia chucula TaxID=3093667 RepID=UPI0039C6B6BB
MLLRLSVTRKSDPIATESVLGLKFSFGTCVTEQASDSFSSIATNVDFGASDVAMTDKARSF